MQTFKLFVSSPGDVMVERRRVENVVSRLNGEFAGVARLEAIRWETEFYQAYSTFQAQIPRSTDCDLVIGILKWRLGTELPPDFAETLPNGQPFPSGTAYEILTAIEKRQKGVKLPDIYVFRFNGPSPSPEVEDPNRQKIEHDWLALKGFFQEWFLTERGHFKAAFNPYSSEDDFEAQLERLLRGWVADKVAGGKVVRWPIEVMGSPFRGLAAFGAKHAPVFFGRSHDTARAVDLWREAGSRGSPYLLVVGASGSGKSSLARAGLVPRLTTPGVIKEVDVWRTAVMRPGDSSAGPFAALAVALMQDEAGLPKEEEGRGPALPEIGQGDSRTPTELASVLRHAGDASIRPIVNALARVAAGEHDREGYRREVRCDLVLLIDQLEELFAASVSQEERTGFVDLVAALIRTGRIWVVATLRADLYARMLDQPPLKRLKELGATYDLAPPGPVELAEIVRAPAEAAGLVYETDAATGEGVDVRLLHDADRPDMLPLVQLALSRLFEGRDKVGSETRLLLKVYVGLGGLKGIINEAGEKAVESLGEAEKARLPRLLRQLAVPAQRQGGAIDAAPTIRAVPSAQAAPDDTARKLLNALVTARLLTTSGDEADAQVRLAHQRVLEDWGRARTIVAESADFIRIHAELEEGRSKWATGDRRGELLLARGLPLAEAESIVGKYGDELAPEVRAYVRASRQRANRAQMIGWGVAAAFLLAAIVAGIAAKVAFDQRAAAEANASAEASTTSLFRAEQSDRALNGGDAVTAALLALEGLPDAKSNDSFQRTRPYVSEAERALYAAWQARREQAILAGHTDAVTSAVFSPDGSRMLTASDDNTARLWSADGKPLAILAGHTGPVSSAVFSPDGSRILTASGDATARLWSADGQPLATLVVDTGYTGPVLGAVFSPDGSRILTATNDATARLWGADGKPLAILAGHNSHVVSAVFSPDGSHIVTASDDNTARLWSADGMPLAVLEGHTGPVNSAVFSPEGNRILTASDDMTARLWSTDGKPLFILEGHTGPVRSAVFSPDGSHILTASDDMTARLWNADGILLTTLSGHTGIVRSALFSRDGGHILTASNDKTARLWSADGKPLTILAGHTDSVPNAVFSPDGSRILTASNDKTARLWSADAMQPAILAGHESRVGGAVFSPDGSRIVTASDDNTARLWSADGQQLATLAGHTDWVLGAVFSPDGSRVLTASRDKTARLWSADGQPLTTLAGHTDWVMSAVFSPDGSRILTSSADKTARLWTADGKPLAVLSGHTSLVNSAVFSRDGSRILTASMDNTARLWSADGQALAVLAGHQGWVNSAVFSPDGSRIVSASDDNTARLWSSDGELLATLAGDTWYVTSAVFSPDGKRILTASDDSTARLWSADGQRLAVLAGHKFPVRSAEFSPDGKRILTASEDKTARLWTADGQPLAILVGHTRALRSAVFSPDASRILTASEDDTARLWEAFPTAQTLIDHVKQVLPRCLTPDQRQTFLLPPEAPSWCETMAKWPPAAVPTAK